MEERIIKDINNLFIQLFQKMQEAGYEWDAEKKELKNIEQKPAWSEEDEELMKWSIINLTELKDRFGEEYGKVGDCIDWLKSLRPQNRWKPSDKQLRQLELAIDYWKPNNTTVTTTLFKLWEDLKKLK